METTLIMVFLVVIIPTAWYIADKRADKRAKEIAEKRERDLIERARPEGEAMVLRSKIEGYQRMLKKRMQEELDRRVSQTIQKIEEESLKKTQAEFGYSYVRCELLPRAKIEIEEREKLKMKEEMWWEKEFAKIKKSPQYQELLKQREDIAYRVCVQRYGKEIADKFSMPQRLMHANFIYSFYDHQK
ncbi:hypothetical protein LJC45_03175 [Alistipes sp. OttesenSCG-928-B03]|nr:hypothetical protein [Alistipes sp. OttesenSCG-928-B03]